MAEISGLSYTNLITSEKDKVILESVIKPKLKLKKPVNLYCSLTYITPNYSGINLLHELSELAKSGFNISLVLWDINMKSHDRFRALLEEENHRITADELIQEKVDEVWAILEHFKTPGQRIKLYLASDVLQRFISKKEPNRFIQFYSVLEKMQLNNLAERQKELSTEGSEWHPYKVSHLIQMPTDIFFANFFHELYPEDQSSKAEVTLIYDHQQPLYEETIDIMYQHNLINNHNPLILSLPAHPYLIYNNNLPEWRMSRHSTINHIIECAPTTQQIMQVYEVILKKFLKAFELLDEKSNVKSLPWDKFVKENAKADIRIQQASLGHNLRTYLRDIKRSVIIKRKPAIVYLDEANVVKMARVLSRKPIISILKKIDGIKTQTELSRELKMAPSNMNLYINILKNHDMVEIDAEGIIHRKISAINANFEVGMN